MKIKIILYVVFISSIFISQNNGQSDISQITFKVSKYKGNIDNSPITMLLTFYPDSNIIGYYYYDKVGRLFTVKNLRENKSSKLEAEQIELFTNNGESRDREIFEFSKSIFMNQDNITGKWIRKNKVFSVYLTKENLRFDWRLFTYKSVGYFNNSTFTEQTKDYSIIYPSLSTNPKLNTHFLNENNFLDRNTIDFINSTESKYLLIEQNFGENTDENDDCCWSDYSRNELVYISDSILTYCNIAMSYAYNAQYYTDFISVNVTNGTIYSAKNIFEEDKIDSVLTLLRNKYKNILRQEGSNSNINDEAPLPTDYTNESNIYISKGGIYFSERSYKLANYYDLFLSFDEINNYLNRSFKVTIGLR